MNLVHSMSMSTSTGSQEYRYHPYSTRSRSGSAVSSPGIVSSPSLSQSLPSRTTRLRVLSKDLDSARKRLLELRKKEDLATSEIIIAENVSLEDYFRFRDSHPD